MKRAERLSRSGPARGRMYLKARLGWLSGFPLRQSAGEITWLALPRHGDRQPQEISLTGHDLHRAARTWQTLTRRFPRALPRIVENLGHWRVRVPQLIALLSEAIHQGAPLPRSLFDAADFYPSALRQEALALAADRPSLGPWLAALSWYANLYPAEAAAALAWSREYAGELTTILTYNEGLAGVVVTQQLWSLTARDSEARVAPLRRLLGNPAVYTTPTVDGRAYSEGWIRFVKVTATGKETGAAPVQPETFLGAAFVTFLAALVGKRRQERRNALALFDLVWPEEVLPAWSAWWEETERLADRAKRLGHLRHRAELRTESKKLRRRLHARTEQLPPPIHPQHLVACVQRAAPEPAFCKELRQILLLAPKLGHGALVRAALLDHWLSILPAYEQQLTTLLGSLRASWGRVEDRPVMLAFWRSLFDSWRRGRLGSYRWLLEKEILLETPEQRLWPIICDTLVACAGVSLRLDAEKAQDGDDAEVTIGLETLIDLAKLTEDAAEAKKLVALLATQTFRSDYLPPELLNCASRLDDGRGHFGRLVAALQAFSPDDYRFVAALRATADHLESGGWPGLAAQMCLQGQVKRLVQIGQRLQVLAQFGLADPPPAALPPAESPAWIEAYPERLGPALRLLAALHPAAQKAAARVLSKDFPGEERLQKEIAVLRQKLAENPAQPNLAQRLGHLEQRLASPRPVSAPRLARLEEKLVWLVGQQALAVWEEEIEAALRPALAMEAQVDEAPDWMLDPQQLQVISRLQHLPAAFRQLAWRLLRQRCGSPPWSLIDDPANQRFIAEMEQRGVHMEPWLNPPAPRRFTGGNGRVVQLHFEGDPLEIFQMGHHFNTCLSPENFNFFSVFANAADINKHVVYARDGRGQVVGRCLLALTEEGTLLTFEPYCHDPELGFRQMMAETAADLAAKMGAPLHIRGRVPALVAPDWYDDGPHDVCGRFTFLEKGSDFRQAWPKMTPEAFVQELEALFAPLPLNALTLPLILNLPKLRKRPTFFQALLPYIEAEQALPDDWMVIAIKLAHQAGEVGFVRRMVQGWAPAYLKRCLRHRYWVDMDLVMLVAEIEPSAALRFLRRSRPYNVHRDEEEQGSRREALAIAHENLGRHARAQKLRAGVKEGPGQAS